jgi:hypothetical protein
MIGRPLALVAGLVVLGLVAAQIVVPTWGAVHTETYAVTVAVGLIVLGAYALRASKGNDGERGRRFALCAVGAGVIGLTGLASGLLGPETQTLVRAPGTVAALPGLGVSGVFPIADDAMIGHGDARVALRRGSGAETELTPGQPRLVGTAVFESRARPAAYVSAFDQRGRHLTITQPTGPAFLSPVLQFVQTIGIAGRVLPSDTFATPAVHRLITVIYISSKDAAAMHSARLGDRDVVLFSVRDDRGHGLPNGIGVAASGQDVRVADLILHPVLGDYPELIVGSAPHPLTLWIGGTCIVAGFVLAYASRRPAGAGPAAAPTPS